VNYFELYPGDYLRDTTRLTLLEHGVYLRLLMAYYAEERPLPGDNTELLVIAGAISSADKAAVRKVAERFFPLGDDGLRHNARADDEIKKAQRRIETARQNGGKGGRKPKPSNNPAGYPVGSSRDTPEGTQRGTHSGEALHTPHASTTTTTSQALTTTEAGRACRLMREAGCTSTNPSHPNLLAALAEGVTPEALYDTTREAIEGGKGQPFAWAIATARSRRAEGASTTTGANHGNHESRTRGESAVERVERANRKAGFPSR
jgi:uncharacterized protein YdaU (DUF1376 family)